MKDASDLQDIKNVKGDETFTQNGNDLTWSTDGKDIYYQGKTEKNLPVSVGIKYYMDGTEVSPEALAGKTGHLKMEVTYTNTSKTTKTVNGKKTDIYSPFVMVTGMILSTDNFSNITVDNGKVISDGSRNVVVGFGMPGMKESLDMSSDIADEVNIPEGFTVEADVTDCEMNSTFTVALTDIFKDIDLNDVDGLDELKDSMKDLTDAAVKLVDGTKDLYDGTNKLNDKYKEFYDGIGTLKSGVSDLNDGAKELDDGAKELSSGAQTLNTGAQTLNSGVSSYTAGADTLSDGIKQYTAGVDTLDSKMAEYEAGMKSLSDGVNAYVAGGNQLAGGVGQYAGGIKSLVDGIGQVVPGIDTAVNGIQTAVEKMTALSSKIDANQIANFSDSMTAYTTGVSDYTSAVGQYIESVEQLASGLSQLESSLENMGASTASEIEESANAMSGQLNDSAETMNSQADAIESWISDSAEASVDASSVDAGVAAVSSQLEAAESALYNIDTSNMDDETAAAVENAIKELNYVHNLAARTLRSKKSEIIGVMINGFENPYFLEILQGIEHILSEKGYQMILGNTGRSMDAQEKQLDIFNSWCVDGIITYGQGYQNLFQKYDSLNCPVVCIESPGGNQTDNVIIDDCALIREAITDMIQCGHRKIGCIYGVSDAYTTIQRTNGYKEGLLVNKIKADDTIIRCGESTLEGGYRETNWLLENTEIDAIFVENNLMTLGCVKALFERGVEIPDQIALLGYDDDDWRDTLVIPISSIHPPRYEMGEKATRLLLQRINYPKRKPITIKLSPELIKRKSY